MKSQVNIHDCFYPIQNSHVAANLSLTHRMFSDNRELYLLKIFSQYFSEFDVYFSSSYFHIFSCCCCIPISWKDREEYRVPLWPRGKMPAKNAELLVKVTNNYKMD